jgi:hypothetical protein
MRAHLATVVVVSILVVPACDGQKGHSDGADAGVCLSPVAAAEATAPELPSCDEAELIGTCAPARSALEGCIGRARRGAERMCARRVDGPGYGVDNRPVANGGEARCVEGWVRSFDALCCRRALEEAASSCPRDGTCQRK